MAWSDDELTNAVRTCISELGPEVTSTAYLRWHRRTPDTPGLATIVTRFGGWAAAVTAAGGTPPGHPPTWTAADATEALSRFLAERAGRPVRGTDYRRWVHSQPEPTPSEATILRLLRKPWSELTGSPPLPRWTDAQLHATLTAFLASGPARTLVAYEQWRARQPVPVPHSVTLTCRYGSWAAAVNPGETVT